MTHVWSQLKNYIYRKATSRDEAKGRLHLVLAHDRAGIDGAKLQDLRRELAQVISRYVEIDIESVEIEIERVSREGTQLIISSPLRAR